VLDVAIALSFVFFLLSLVVSAITEGVSWLFKLRAKTLEKGVEGMLGKGGIATEIMKHALVQSDVTTPAKKGKPSYLSARNFSLALVDVLAKQDVAEQGDSAAPEKVESKEDPTTLDRVESGVEKVAGQSPLAAVQLQALLGESATADLARFRKSAEEWFDDAMDRVSGWYKRRAQVIVLVAALVVAVGLKADAVRITEQLVNEPTVRAAVVAKAEQAASSEKDPKAAGETADKAVTELNALKLPILWDKSNDDVDASVIAGLLLTTIAISLGAPFWFDALNKLAHLRTTGKKPEPEK
jgi:hypothetical protein